MLVAAFMVPIVVVAEDKVESPKDVFKLYLTETSVPAIPAATLLGVDKSKIVEVSSVSKLATQLSVGQKANADGTPFGLDIAPAQLLAAKGDALASAIEGHTYAADMGARLWFRTRISLATTKKDNTSATAWGLYTRPIDLRDPFVDPKLDRCLADFIKEFRKVKSPPIEIPGNEIERVRNLYNALSAFPPNENLTALRVEVGAAIDKPTSVSEEKWKAWINVLKMSAPAEVDKRRAELQVGYESCSKKALEQLANRSYLALGYGNGSARAVDAAKPVNFRPGNAFWMTFVYGFEGLGNVFGGEDNWRRTSEGSPTAESLLEQNGRLVLFYSRQRDSTKLVENAEQSTAGSIYGVGFDYTFDKKGKLSFQTTRSQLGQGSMRSNERVSVIGADVRLAEGVWLGLSRGKRTVSGGASETETRADFKWAFSEKCWMCD